MIRIRGERHYLSGSLRKSKPYAVRESLAELRHLFAFLDDALPVADDDSGGEPKS